jgi:hypothetical protein
MLNTLKLKYQQKLAQLAASKKKKADESPKKQYDEEGKNKFFRRRSLFLGPSATPENGEGDDK